MLRKSCCVIDIPCKSCSYDNISPGFPFTSHTFSFILLPSSIKLLYNKALPFVACVLLNTSCDLGFKSNSVNLFAIDLGCSTTVRDRLGEGCGVNFCCVRLGIVADLCATALGVFPCVLAMKISLFALTTVSYNQTVIIMQKVQITILLDKEQSDSSTWFIVLCIP